MLKYYCLWLILIILSTSAYSQEWTRQPLFPIGYAEVVATDVVEDGQMIAMDICGRVLKYDADTAVQLAYPYTESSVKKVLRTRKGYFVLYYDGTLMTAKALPGPYTKVMNEEVRDVAPDGSGYGYILVPELGVMTIEFNLFVPAKISRVWGIASCSPLSFTLLDSMGLTVSYVEDLAGWTAKDTVQIPNFNNRLSQVAAIAIDSLFLNNGSASFSFSTSDGGMRTFNIDSIVGRGMVSNLNIRVDSSGFTASGLSTKNNYEVVTAVYSFVSRSWRGLNVGVLIPRGNISSVRLTRDYTELGTYLGCIYRHDATGYSSLVSRNRTSCGWVATDSDGEHVVFIAKTLSLGTFGTKSGYLIASYSPMDKEWTRIREIVEPLQWPYDYTDHVVATGTRDTVIMYRVNQVIQVSMLDGSVSATVKIPQAISKLRRLADGNYIAATFDCKVYVLDPSLNIIQSDTTQTGCLAVRFGIGTDGTVAVAALDQRILIYRLATRTWTDKSVAGEPSLNIGALPERGALVPLLLAEDSAERLKYGYKVIDYGGNVTDSQSSTVQTFGQLNQVSSADGPVIIHPGAAIPGALVFDPGARTIYSKRVRSNWNGRWDFRSNGLVAHLADSTSLIIYDCAEMWLFDRKSPATLVHDAVPTYVSRISIYPNPASMQVNMDIGLLSPTTAEECVISITTLLGQKVLTTTVGSYALSNRSVYVLDVSTVSPGFYILSVAAGGYTSSRPLLISR